MKEQREKFHEDRRPDGISFVIPVYNEELEIVPTIKTLQANLEKLDRPFEVIVVDDGSSDDTLARTLELKDVQVISHPVNSGYGRSLKTGILAAHYDWIGITDADGTYDISQLEKLVAEMDKGFDMVVAHRQNISEHDSLAKQFSRKLLVTFIQWIVSGRLVDPNSGFRIFKRDLAILFFPFLCNTFSFTTSISLFSVGEGFFIKMVKTQYFPRSGKSKVRKFRDSARMVQLVLQGITFFNPLKFYLLLALLQVTGVCIPSLGLYYLGWSAEALILFSTGTVALLFVALGVHADIVRITANYDFSFSDNLRLRRTTVNQHKLDGSTSPNGNLRRN